MPKVIYLTGAPASGKSTTTSRLVESMPGIMVWEYGARLTAFIAERDGRAGDQDELRSKSASVVGPEDIAAVDKALIAFVNEHRKRSHVIIDSHPVTKEIYGYRITPFSLQDFSTIQPDEIWVLYADPTETRRRISVDPGGRPLVTEEEARMHTALQSAVASTYAMSIGCPAYIFDTSQPRNVLLATLLGRLK